MTNVSQIEESGYIITREVKSKILELNAPEVLLRNLINDVEEVGLTNQSSKSDIELFIESEVKLYSSYGSFSNILTPDKIIAMNAYADLTASKDLLTTIAVAYRTMVDAIVKEVVSIITE